MANELPVQSYKSLINSRINRPRSGNGSLIQISEMKKQRNKTIRCEKQNFQFRNCLSCDLVCLKFQPSTCFQWCYTIPCPVNYARITAEERRFKSFVKISISRYKGMIVEALRLWIKSFVIGISTPSCFGLVQGNRIVGEYRDHYLILSSVFLYVNIFLVSACFI